MTSMYKFPVEWIPVGGSSKADEKCRRHSTSVLFISFYPQSSSILLIPVFIVIKVHLMAKLTDKNDVFRRVVKPLFTRNFQNVFFL